MLQVRSKVHAEGAIIMNSKLLCAYVCIASFLFVYELPFIYTGLPGTSGRTILDNLPFREYPTLCVAATWFAKQETLRIILTFTLVGMAVFAEIRRSFALRYLILQVVLWVSLVAASLSVLGLMSILV
jgi:hypothetical protein